MAQKTEPQLQGRDWIIESIDGRAVVDGSVASLSFGQDGQLSGNATCNRIIGTYTENDGTITLGPLGTTMMACPEAFMDQERRLLDILDGPVMFDVGDDGGLVLRGASNRLVIARQP